MPELMSKRLVGAAAALLISVGSGCETRWGNEELHGQISATTPERVATITIESGEEPIPLPVDLLPGLLAQIRDLTPAKTIGKSSPWSVYCEIGLEVVGEGEFLIRLGTRSSLHGTPVAILRDKTGSGPRIAFYDGENLLAWLTQHGHCSA